MSEIPDEEDTDVKLAMLASEFPTLEYPALLEALVDADGSLAVTCKRLRSIYAPAEDAYEREAKRQKRHANGLQTSLQKYSLKSPSAPKSRLFQTKKGKTLHLYSPEDIENNTPCSIIHNFLPKEQADELLKELLSDAKTFERTSFKLFDVLVESPHSSCFYVENLEEQQRQKTEYLYNGSHLTDIRQISDRMREVSVRVEEATNKEIERRIRDFNPGGQKLKYQSLKRWRPNAAFVNCYSGGKESVGWHADQLTYLGPRAVIGSLSLGVTREFRVRKIVPKDDGEPENDKSEALRGDQQGQIAIHLPHNSFLVMHAEMQEEWKHSIHPAPAIDPHPIAGNKRINITYRCYRADLHPKLTPKCRCGIATVLRCVQKSTKTQGRYMWMCQAAGQPGKSGCSFFEWANFDNDGEVIWQKTPAKIHLD